MNPFKRSRRRLLALLPAPLLAAAPAPARAAEDKVHRLAIHVDDRDEAKMNLALNNATNVSEAYTAMGHEVEVEIVAYGPGLHMLREDTAPEAIRARVKSFVQSMPNVAFSACDNTRKGMAKAEGKTPDQIPIVANARIVAAGVVRLMELQEQGWSYVKP